MFRSMVSKQCVMELNTAAYGRQSQKKKKDDGGMEGAMGAKRGV